MNHIDNLTGLIRQAARKHDTYQVFRDFCPLSAISMSNAVDHAQRETREAEYMQIIGRYERAEIGLFPKMLGDLTLALEDEPHDVLGRVFTTLELGNKWKGQFFTPDNVCRAMAAMSLGDDARALIEKRGYIRAMEPAVGGGAMVIALAREMLARDINYQQHLHVTAVDVDIRAVHMAYVQLSLLHVPAVVIHGDTLAMEEYGHWYTPAHILGLWRSRLARDTPAAPVSTASAPRLAPKVAQADDRPIGTQLSLF